MLGSGKEIQNNGASLCALHISLLCNFITTVVKGSLSCFNGEAHNGLALRFSNKQTFVLVLLDSVDNNITCYSSNVTCFTVHTLQGAAQRFFYYVM